MTFFSPLAHFSVVVAGFPLNFSLSVIPREGLSSHAHS